MIEEIETLRNAEDSPLRVVVQTGCVPTIKKLEHGREEYSQQSQDHPELKDSPHLESIEAAA